MPGASSWSLRPGAALRVVARLLGVEIDADELAPEDPLIRHLADRRLARGGQEGVGDREPARGDRGVHGRLGDLHLGHGAAVQLVLAGHRDARAAHRLPVGQHDLVGDVAPDVVVVERAHAGGQAGGRIEQDGQGLLPRAIVHRGMADPADRDARGGGDPVRVLRHLEREQGRLAEQLALRGGQPQARHRVRGRVGLPALLGAAVAVDARHVAGLRGHDLAVGEGARGGIVVVAHPVVPGRAGGHVGDRDQRRVVAVAHLAARGGGLLGIPLPDGRLVGDGLDRGQRVRAALGRDRPGHEVPASRLHGSAGHDHDRDGQRNGERHCGALHGFSPREKLWMAAQYPGARGTVKPEPSHRRRS